VRVVSHGLGADSDGGDGESKNRRLDGKRCAATSSEVRATIGGLTAAGQGIRLCEPKTKMHEPHPSVPQYDGG
jgi:hypothetical protein